MACLGQDRTERRSSGSKSRRTEIAVHSSYKQGEAWQERTDWFRLVAFGDAGEALNRFGKGERVRVVGRLQSSSYTDRDGRQRTCVELVVLHSESAPLHRKGAAAAVSEAGAQRLHADEAPAAEEPLPEPEAAVVSEADAQRLSDDAPAIFPPAAPMIGLPLLKHRDEA